MKFMIIGSGAAGMAAARELRRQREDAEICVISEDRAPYARCMLHKYVSHERTIKSLDFTEKDFFTKYCVRQISECTVESVLTQEKYIVGDGKKIFYDKLLIATGSVYGIPPIPNFRTANNVFGFRDLKDAVTIDEQSKDVRKAFIVGSGLVGMDVAYALLKRNISVTVAEMATRIMPLQTDEISAGIYQKLFEDAGVTFRLGIGASNSVVNEENCITEVILSNGEKISCDYVVVAAGVSPNISFLRNSGLTLDRGIVVDDYLQTSNPDIFAAGDVTALSGIWPNAVMQGMLAARNMAGKQELYQDRFWIKNTMNFFGLPMLSVGDVSPKGDDFLMLADAKDGQYKKIILKDHRITGVQLVGDISHGGVWQYLIMNQIPIEEIENDIFEVNMSDFYGFAKDARQRRVERVNQMIEDVL